MPYIHTYIHTNAIHPMPYIHTYIHTYINTCNALFILFGAGVLVYRYCIVLYCSCEGAFNERMECDWWRAKPLVTVACNVVDADGGDVLDVVTGNAGSRNTRRWETATCCGTAPTLLWWLQSSRAACESVRHQIKLDLFAACLCI